MSTSESEVDAAPTVQSGITLATPGYARALRSFLAYLRVECGLAAATLEAYTRDIDDLVGDLLARGVSAVGEVTPAHLVEHVRFLSRDRKLDPTTIVRHVSSVRVFFRYLHANREIP
jgi:integrase/recombinase XerD